MLYYYFALAVAGSNPVVAQVHTHDLLLGPNLLLLSLLGFAYFNGAHVYFGGKW